jgi:hypothetical protein
MENDHQSVRNSLRIIQEMNWLEPGGLPACRSRLRGTIEQRDDSTERVAVALKGLHAQRRAPTHPRTRNRPRRQRGPSTRHWAFGGHFELARANSA